MNSYDAMIFSGETPMMSGTWYNPQTGDSFTVADAFFQDNQYLVKTMDGRILDYNIIKNYIKSDKPIPTQKNPVKEQLPKEVSNILLKESGNSNSPLNDTLQNDILQNDILQNDILPEDMDLIKPRSLGNLNAPTNAPINTPAQPHNPFGVIIERALAKKDQPLLDVKVNWENFPRKEIELLTSVLDLSIDEIIQWYISQIDMSQIESIVAKTLTETINREMGGVKVNHENNIQSDIPSDIPSDTQNTISLEKQDPPVLVKQQEKTTKNRPKKSQKIGRKELKNHE